MIVVSDPSIVRAWGQDSPATDELEPIIQDMRRFVLVLVMFEASRFPSSGFLEPLSAMPPAFRLQS